MRLQNKVAVVTASTRGIGAAIVETFTKEGAKVYMAVRNLEKAQEMAERLNAEGGQVYCVYNDATKQETYKTMIEEVAQKEGRIDILVNNYGGSDPRKDLDIKLTTYEDFIQTLDQNIGSVFIASQAVIPHMAKMVVEASSIFLLLEVFDLIYLKSPMVQAKHPLTTLQS